MFSFLARWGIDVTSYDRWEFFFAGASSPLLWAAGGVAFLSALLWTWSSVRELPSRRLRLFLAAAQLLTLALLLLLIFQPGIRLAKTAPLKDRVAVLIDTSASMSLPTGNKNQSRAEEAFAFLAGEEKFFRRLEENFVVSYFGFDVEQQEISSRPESPLPSQGPGTDLAAALSVLGVDAVPLAGVILISDGADTSRLGQLQPAAGDSAEIRRLLAGFPAPVNTVLCGRQAEVKDLAIVSVTHDDYGFVHNPFEVEIEVRVEGDLAREVPVIFKQGERLLSSKTISLSPGQRNARATLSFTPRQVGEFMFTVEIPAVPGELTEINNVVRFPLKVLRDKVRILYLVGNPSWDERFLRQALKKNPIVDLVSFYILREYHDFYYAAQNEVSLIEFPTHQLFTEELDTFDLLIWQNFWGPEYMEPHYSDYMKELHRFVWERGGALLMIGGLRGFWGKGKMDPYLEALLPVELAEEVPNYVSAEVKVELTPTGLRHPIMQVAVPEEELAQFWRGLPPLEGYNQVRRARPDSLVLAVIPDPSAPEGSRPLLALREAGAGRVMTVMTDCSWQWSLPAVGAGLSSKPYQRFWENALRWLLRDPELRLITFSSDRGRLAPGEKVTLMIEVLDESYTPTDQAQLKVEVVEQPEGSPLLLPPLSRHAAGKYEMVIAPEAEGAYCLRASGMLDGRALGFDDAIFEVSRTSVEWFHVIPRPDLLQALSISTGGAALRPGENPERFIFRPSGQQQIIGAQEIPLWDNAPVFLVLFGLMAGCWFLRRRWGLR